MNKYLELFRDHLAAQAIEFNDYDAASMLDFLFCCYTEDHPLDNNKIRQCYEKLEPVFDSLPNYLSNQLFQNIAAVCIEFELAAFTEGMRVGAALERELRA